MSSRIFHEEKFIIDIARDSTSCLQRNAHALMYHIANAKVSPLEIENWKQMLKCINNELADRELLEMSESDRSD